MEGIMKLYMAVTLDKYELPIAVSETVAELARMVGVNEASIWHAMSYAKKKNFKRRKYVKVEV
jgi:hypothetical protein